MSLYSAELSLGNFLLVVFVTRKRLDLTRCLRASEHEDQCIGVDFAEAQLLIIIVILNQIPQIRLIYSYLWLASRPSPAIVVIRPT